MDKRYDLQFYENRSTPQVLLHNESPRPKKNYGKPTSRRPASESEQKVIHQGKWVRVDEAGNTPKSPEYKKTGYRPWLVSKSAFGVEHISKKVFERDGNVSAKEAGAVAAGVGAAGTGVAIAPIKMDMPKPDRKVRTIRGRKARTKDLRSVATHEGKRFGNDTHISRLAQNIRRKGFDRKQPIEVTRYKDGTQRVVGGHHRLAAAERLGLRRVPVKVTRSNDKTAQVGTSLFGMRRKKRDIARGRQPNKKMSRKELKASASKKINPVLEKINDFHAAKGNLENAYNVKYRPQVERAAKNPKVLAGAGGVAAGGIGAKAYLDRKR